MRKLWGYSPPIGFVLFYVLEGAGACQKETETGEEETSLMGNGHATITSPCLPFWGTWGMHAHVSGVFLKSPGLRLKWQGHSCSILLP